MPDLPFDEVKPFCSEIKKSNISPILLVAPNTPPKRIQEISELAGDLIYAVSILGITGNKLSSKDKLRDYLKQVRLNSKTPFVVGFEFLQGRMLNGLISILMEQWLVLLSSRNSILRKIIIKVVKTTLKC